MEGQFNLRPYGLDSVSNVKTRVEYDEKKMMYSSYSLKNGNEILVLTSEVDGNDRPIRIQEFRENGDVSTSFILLYDSEGRLIRSESHFNEEPDMEEDCSDLHELVLEYEYHPNGLLQCIDVTSDKGKCGLMFSYK